MRPSLRAIGRLLATLGCASLFVGVAPTLAQGPNQPTSIYFKSQVLAEINRAQTETRRVRYETYFCLLGKRVGNDFYISGFYIPEQEKFVGFALVPELGRIALVSRTTPKENCPEDAIGDLHTHPWQNEASSHDKFIWLLGDFPFDLHMVVYTSGSWNKSKIYLKMGNKLYLVRTKKPSIVGKYDPSAIE